MRARPLAVAFAAVSLIAIAACSPSSPEAETETAAESSTGELATVVAGAHRAEADAARDRYRHPVEVLQFYGLEPDMTVVELNPGGGYWSDILGPYLATEGNYVAAPASEALQERLSNAALYGAPTYAEFGAESGPLVEPGTADMVLTFRNIHNWLWQEGMVEKVMSDAYEALAPGGVLGVVEHRADPREMTVQNGRAASDGYVATQTVIDAAEAAGFQLEASSEINANPADTKDHPFGVWTLPPSSSVRGEPPADFDPQKYLDIGESDRMTLKFVKPA